MTTHLKPNTSYSVIEVILTTLFQSITGLLGRADMEAMGLERFERELQAAFPTIKPAKASFEGDTTGMASDEVYFKFLPALAKAG